MSLSSERQVYDISQHRKIHNALPQKPTAYGPQRLLQRTQSYATNEQRRRLIAGEYAPLACAIGRWSR